MLIFSQELDIVDNWFNYSMIWFIHPHYICCGAKSKRIFECSCLSFHICYKIEIILAVLMPIANKSTFYWGPSKSGLSPSPIIVGRFQPINIDWGEPYGFLYNIAYRFVLYDVHSTVHTYNMQYGRLTKRSPNGCQRNFYITELCATIIAKINVLVCFSRQLFKIYMPVVFFY